MGSGDHCPAPNAARGIRWCPQNYEIWGFWRCPASNYTQFAGWREQTELKNPTRHMATAPHLDKQPWPSNAWSSLQVGPLESNHPGVGASHRPPCPLQVFPKVHPCCTPFWPMSQAACRCCDRGRASAGWSSRFGVVAVGERLAVCGLCMGCLWVVHTWSPATKHPGIQSPSQCHVQPSHPWPIQSCQLVWLQASPPGLGGAKAC